jgi:hypothetical protein
MVILKAINGPKTMPITVTLIEQDDAVLVKLSDPWDIAEMARAFEQDKAIRDASRFAYVHAIIDLTESHHIPPGVVAVGRSTPSIKHPTAGYIAIFGADGFIRAIAEKVFQLVRFKRTKFCADYDEALAFIRAIISTDDKKPTDSAPTNDTPVNN